MKSFLKVTVLILGMVFVLSLPILAQGRNVTITLRDSTTVKGEVLVVRDSLVVIYLKPLYNDMDIYYEFVRVEKFATIESITAHRNHAFTTGIVVAAASFAGGIAYNINGPRVETGYKYSLFKETRPANSNGYILMMAGPMISLIVGAAMNKPEQTFSFNTVNNTIALRQDTTRNFQWTEGIQELKKIARFKENEPRHVREIIAYILKGTE